MLNMLGKSLAKKSKVPQLQVKQRLLLRQALLTVILYGLLLPSLIGAMIGLLVILVLFGGFFPWTSSNLTSILQVMSVLGILLVLQYIFRYQPVIIGTVA
jgi:hypothetical protein